MVAPSPVVNRLTGRLPRSLCSLFILAFFVSCTNDPGTSPVPPDPDASAPDISEPPSDITPPLSDTALGEDISEPTPGSLIWPEASLVVPGAYTAGLARFHDGRISLVYQEGEELWLHPNPPEGVALRIAEASGQDRPIGDLKVLASPEDARALAVWTRPGGTARALFFTAEEVLGEPFSLVRMDTWELLDIWAYGLGWSDGEFVISARPSSCPLGQQCAHYTMAFAVPEDAPDIFPLPPPASNHELLNNPPAMRGYNEGDSIIELPDGKVLIFASWRRFDQESDTSNASWVQSWRDGLRTGPASNYFVRGHTGSLELPLHGVAWITAHDLGDGNYALTWALSPNSLVFDVFIAGMTLDEEGRPSLTTEATNVSMTLGLTDHSDLALVRPTGDGRYWMAWRETNYGPRVALLSSQFQILAIAYPDEEFNVNMSLPIAIEVDQEGTLHLVATFGDGTHEIRYFRIVLP